MLNGSITLDDLWILVHEDNSVIKLYQRYCEMLYPHLIWEIKETNNISILTPNVLFIDNNDSHERFIQRYRNLMYHNNRKKIPDCVINGPLKNRKAFWFGLFNDIHTLESLTLNITDQLAGAQICYLANLLDYKILIDNRSSKPDQYKIILNKSIEYYNVIKTMYEIPYNDYVYDLTTDNHHFQAGMGQLIVHNTDSIFNDFVIKKKETGEIIHTKEALQPAIELGILVSKFVQSRLRFPHELSYEKTFFPFAIFSKKRYVGNKYTDDDKEFTQTSMGIVLKRRDNAQIVKRVIGGMVEIMMNEIDCDKTIIFTKKSIRDIFKGKYPIKDFVTSKTIKDINKYKLSVKKDKKGNIILDNDGN
jgi:hypothetical protein